MAIWNPPAETLPRDQLESLPLDRLRSCVTRVLGAVAPLAARLRDLGVVDASSGTRGKPWVAAHSKNDLAVRVIDRRGR